SIHFLHRTASCSVYPLSLHDALPISACNHVGCSTSAAMLKKLDQVVARNEPEDLTVQSFIQEWGERVLAEPPAKGFNRLAWFIPDRKSTRLNSSHGSISYAVFCLKKK